MMKLPKRLFPKRDRDPAPQKDPIRFAVWAAIQEGRLKGMTDPDEIRRAVLDRAKEAIEGGKQEVKRVTIDSQEELVISVPTIFRLAFKKLGVDRNDLHAQEVVFARIDRTIAEVLAG
jgi:hypothetical protein